MPFVVFWMLPLAQYTHSLLHKHQQVVHDPVLAPILTSLFYGLAHQARAEVEFTARRCEEGVTQRMVEAAAADAKRYLQRIKRLEEELAG